MDPLTARAEVLDALHCVDAAQARLRAVPTDLVGNTFRIEMADRLETQSRVTLGLTYRVFGEIADPPDGPDDLPPGIKVKDILRSRLRITAGEVTRRMRLAARISPRRSLTGPARPPELEALAAAVEEGAVGDDHINEVRKALDALPSCVAAQDRAQAEHDLVRHAREQDSTFVTQVGNTLADVYNPDGIFDDSDRAARRCLTLHKQGPDGMSRISGKLTPEARAHLEAIGAAVRPGHHLPDTEQAVVDAATDTRTAGQRLHDALNWGLRTALQSGDLGTHRVVPVTVIARTTVAALEQAARAAVDPNVPMPPPARTGSGARLPMRDLIRMAAAGAVHYLAVFDDHSDRPLYLGRSRRTASVDQRIICYARDGGCTFPTCTAPGDRCEVHHTPDWDKGGHTNADELHFGCGAHHSGATDGTYSTSVTESGRLAWSDGLHPPTINRFHHPDELLRDHHVDDPKPPPP
ncbi:MAG: hypothetical protein K0R68_627 [Mycobacterium sp.]|nr:hypothetical protein [Mycobacterium sp.]